MAGGRGHPFVGRGRRSGAGSVAFTFREERSSIWSLAWGRDARRLAVGLSDGGLVVWDLDEVRTRLTTIGLDQ